MDYRIIFPGKLDHAKPLCNKLRMFPNLVTPTPFPWVLDVEIHIALIFLHQCLENFIHAAGLSKLRELSECVHGALMLRDSMRRIKLFELFPFHDMRKSRGSS